MELKVTSEEKRLKHQLAQSDPPSSTLRKPNCILAWYAFRAHHGQRLGRYLEGMARVLLSFQLPWRSHEPSSSTSRMVRVLPPFYRSLLLAWRGLDGSFSVSRDALVYGASSAHVCSPVSISSTKACYLFLLSESMVSPHCVVKFAGVFGALDWRATRRSLFFFDSLLALFRMIWYHRSRIWHHKLFISRVLTGSRALCKKSRSH